MDIKTAIQNKNNKPIKILIGTPAYGGLCNTAYTDSLIKTISQLSRYNIVCEVKFINNQIVTRARNMISSIFMRDDSLTHMLFIDADIEWNPNDVLLLLSHNLECVIGVYPNKKYYKLGNNIKLNPSSVYFSPYTEKNNLIKIKSAATGFMLLTKPALKRIENDIGTFYLPGNNGEQITLHNYFDCNVVQKDYLTEDYYFSYLFLKNGGEIWADKRIVLKHYGSHRYGELC